MPRSSTAPLQLEILSVRFLNLAPSNYIVDVSSDGIRMRRKGTAKWIGPADWEQVLSAAARTSLRESDTSREMGVGA